MGLGRFITHTMFGRGASDFGAVPVPGSQQFELPAGDEFGSVEIASPGTYTVTTGPELPSALDPQILLGS
jgi:hypothetical protein